MTTCDNDVVAALGQDIAQRIGEPRFNFWFDGNTKFTLSEESLIVGVPNLFFQDWLQNTFGDSVRAAACEIIGRPIPVQFTIDPELFRKSRQSQQAPESKIDRGASIEDRASRTLRSGLAPEASISTRSSIDGPRSSAAVINQPSVLSSQTTPKRTRRWRRLADFVVGSCNRVAHASAQSVIEEPGQGANPLLFHGPVGTGKTHLLEGIYAGLRKAHPEWQVRYVTSEEFTNRFLPAMRSGKLPAFRKCFRECDALLIDDIHFLAKTRATQEEFLHTFDVLFTHDKPLALTCDCHPRLAGELSPELIDRLLGGATWGLEPPDLETRKGILRLRSGRLGLPIADELLAQVAGMLRGNVRELEGALQSIVHYSRVVGRPVDIQLVREALADRLRHAVRIIRLEDVDRVVCRVLRLESGVLRSKERSWAVSHPRMLAMFLSRKHTSAAYSAIGHYFGGLNHSSVVAAEKKIRCWLQENASLSIGTHRPLVRELVDLTERELAR